MTPKTSHPRSKTHLQLGVVDTNLLLLGCPMPCATIGFGGALQQVAELVDCGRHVDEAALKHAADALAGSNCNIGGAHLQCCQGESYVCGNV